MNLWSLDFHIFYKEKKNENVWWKSPINMEDLTQKLTEDQNNCYWSFSKLNRRCKRLKIRDCVQSVKGLDFSLLYMWLLYCHYYIAIIKWSEKKKENNSSERDISWLLPLNFFHSTSVDFLPKIICKKRNFHVTIFN